MHLPNSQLKAIKLLSLSGLIALTQACTIAPFQAEIDTPAPSETAFVSADQDTPVQLSYSHQLPAEGVHAKGPLLNYYYQQNAKNIDMSEFFLNALKNEVQARAMPVTFDGQAADALKLISYDTIVHRSNGFAPLVMIASAKLDLTHQGETYRIGAMIKRAKVPIWTLTEEPLIEATINQPQELLVKEVAAKINGVLFNNQLTDAEVEKLVKEVHASINTDEDSAYQKVYELGFSNNPNALAALKELSSHKAEYIRLAAISGMGMVGKATAFEDLKKLHESGRQWQDRAVALKAIGDIQTPETIAYLKAEQAKWEGDTSTEGVWNKQLLGLFVD
ncbi:HEAT repeat domain-containing protein [Simiduia sp. 21SJ11W-1]|uniref:HEAT repeat domain-containing protein n=1 Tax=Simiduia sp. 21SJ11W-1 TaxID=2909669 RepID=UPI00209D0C7A|nr:HEAT repeat domain-containing protein [Simiduia sp. 21SJ11W-1]UTA48489.1 HEAT repeat domain-containing protein [Simiduia sp. 21SJ11W-1]